jgi:nucleotide-binding universal stress UspA family protein
MSLFRRRSDQPDPDDLGAERVLLASEGRAITPAAIELATRLVRRSGGTVHVFCVVRVWGTSLGLPNPGLMPTKGEWDAQRAVVVRAVETLERQGVDAKGHVLATRKATKRIVGEAVRLDCGAIVMAADPPRNRLLADLMWSQEPQRVRRRAEIPVYLVTERDGEQSS